MITWYRYWQKTRMNACKPCPWPSRTRSVFLFLFAKKRKPVLFDSCISETLFERNSEMTINDSFGQLYAYLKVTVTDVIAWLLCRNFTLVHDFEQQKSASGKPMSLSYVITVESPPQIWRAVLTLRNETRHVYLVFTSLCLSGWFPIIHIKFLLIVKHIDCSI